MRSWRKKAPKEVANAYRRESLGISVEIEVPLKVRGMQRNLFVLVEPSLLHHTFFARTRPFHRHTYKRPYGKARKGRVDFLFIYLNRLRFLATCIRRSPCIKGSLSHSPRVTA